MKLLRLGRYLLFYTEDGDSIFVRNAGSINPEQ